MSAALQRLARWLSVTGMAVSICGGASGGPSKAEAGAVARGKALAEQSCGNCHGLGLTGASPWADAPAFRNMHIDYNAISHERRMMQLHQGHVRRMPPVEISLQQVRDIDAYVRSLQAGN